MEVRTLSAWVPSHDQPPSIPKGQLMDNLTSYTSNHQIRTTIIPKQFNHTNIRGLTEIPSILKIWAV